MKEDTESEALNEEEEKKSEKSEKAEEAFLFEEAEALTEPSPVEDAERELSQDSTRIQIKKTHISSRFVLSDLETPGPRLSVAKCELCEFVSLNHQDLAFLKSHYLETHILRDIDSDVFEAIDSILDKIEPIDEIRSKIAFQCHLCDSRRPFIDRSNLKSHLSESHLNDLDCFNCPLCPRLYKLADDLLAHLVDSHEEEIINGEWKGIPHEDEALDEILELMVGEDKAIKIDAYEEDTVESTESVSSKAKSKAESEEALDEKSGEEGVARQKNRTKKPTKSNSIASSASSSSGSAPPPPVVSIRTWTCQMCKKQFDQRVDLNKHQCIELHLKLLKKKKEIRKKKWREAHWKKKIDLSYIDTTNLTQLPFNIADNLAFCIDGTQEDLRACSKEVKDYLNTELCSESGIQMFLKCCMPEFYQRLASNGGVTDASLLRKANTYFTEGIYLEQNAVVSGKRGVPLPFPSLVNCRICRAKFQCLADLVHHQRQSHSLDIKTAFDRYATNREASVLPENAPVGYLSCDPFSFILNLHWDSTVQKRCENCQKIFTRPKFRKHILSCRAKEVI